MIDLHSHILHAVDDGARTLAEAVAMARMAVEQGVTVMAATPHGHSSLSEWAGYSPLKISQRRDELQAALDAAGIPLAIILGTEIMGEPGALERLQAGQVLPYGATQTVLVEFPLRVTAAIVSQVLADFQQAGYRVVIAHPERYSFVQADPNTLFELVERGALMQLTGDALLGNQGEALQRLAETLLVHGLIQLIASDSHGPQFRRLPNLGAAYTHTAQIGGTSLADALTRTIPAAILADAPLARFTPERVRNWRS